MKTFTAFIIFSLLFCFSVNAQTIENENFCKVEKNGISFEDGVLTINTVSKQNEKQKFQFTGKLYRTIIQIHSGEFIIKTYLNDKIAVYYFFLLPNQGWQKFMKFINEKTHPIGVEFGRETTAYLF